MMDTDRRRFRRRRPWWLVSAIAVVGLLAAAFFLAPQRSARVITVDGSHAWSAKVAPPRRQVVWQPAKEIVAPAAEQRAEDSFIRPQLTEDGTTLYFTLRRSGEGYDIYQSQLDDNVWGPAEPVESLNSTANEIGPVIRADGRQLFFYSDREGGFGGMDLYVSSRTEDGWSEPANLGPRINSPAHEYDPAITPDGKRLFFASNRSARMHQRMADGAEDVAADNWETTLRADLGLRKFDLYVAHRDADEGWRLADPLAALNESNYNEGAPYISPNGIFLYFVSDRPQRTGEEENFDVYRTRIDGREMVAENLGPGVNTPQNEIEPSLSDEGFRLYFSRNNDPEQADEKYTLFESTAEEVDFDVEWDTSNWQAFVAWLGNAWDGFVRFVTENWWWIVLALLAAALLAALIWALRQVSIGRATIPMFLLIALIVHMMMGVSSFFVYFGQDIVAKIKKQIQEQIVASEVMLEPQDLTKPVEQPFDEVVDVQPPEPLQPAEVARQATETPSVAAPTESLQVQTPTPRATPSESEPIVATEPVPQTTPNQETPELQRRTQSVAETSQEVALEQTEAVEQQTQDTPQREQVELSKEVVQVQSVKTPAMLQRQTVAPSLQVVQEQIAAEPVPEINAAAQPTESSLARSESRPNETTEVTPVETQSIAKIVEQVSADLPAVEEVAVNRQVPATPPETVPQTLSRAQVADAVPLQAAADSSVPLESTSESTPVAETRPAAAALERVTQASSNNATSETPVATEAIAVVESSQAAALPSTDASQLEVSRQATAVATPAPESIQLATATQPATPTATADVADFAEALPSAQPQVERTPAQLELARLSTAAQSLESIAPAAVETQTLQAVSSSGSPGTAQESVEVRVAATEVSSQVAPRSLALNVASPLSRTGLSRPDALPREEAGKVSELPESADLAVALQRSAARPDQQTQETAELASASIELPSDAGKPAATATERVGVELTRSAGGQANLPQELGLVDVTPNTAQPGIRGAGLEVSRESAASVLPASESATIQLGRATPQESLADAVEAIAAETETIAVDSPAGRGETAETVGSVSVDVGRPDAQQIGLASDRSALEGPSNSQTPRLVSGAIQRQQFESPLGSRRLVENTLARADAGTAIYASDSVSLQSLLKRRNIDDAMKQDIIKQFGGGDATLETIHRGLSWIEQHQHKDGHWGLHNFHENCRGHKKCKGQGKPADTAGTGLALLPFLGDGNTHQRGKYRGTVARGITWLVSHQKEDGDLFTGGDGNAHMYSHGIATIALCECYGMSKDPGLRPAAQKAIDFIVSAQNEQDGGWRYHPGDKADTSVVGWQVMALKSGQMAELHIPQKTLDGAMRWLESVAGKGGRNGQFAYQGNRFNPTMSAEGLLCMEYLGAERQSPYLRAGGDYLLRELPRKGKDSSYYWYYGTQAMFHL